MYLVVLNAQDNSAFPFLIVERMSITLKLKTSDLAFRGLLVVGDRGVLGRQPIKDGADILTRTVTQCQSVFGRVAGDTKARVAGFPFCTFVSWWLNRVIWIHSLGRLNPATPDLVSEEPTKEILPQE